MLEPGDDAPDFELPNQNGETVALSEYRGETVVVYFYPRAATPGCTDQARSFRDNWDAYEERDIAVLGISDDPVEDLADFAETFDLPVQLLSDEDGSVASAYDSYGKKNVFGNEVTGVFRNTYVVDEEGRISRVYEDVDPEGHAAELLSDLEA